MHFFILFYLYGGLKETRDDAAQRHCYAVIVLACGDTISKYGNGIGPTCIL